MELTRSDEHRDTRNVTKILSCLVAEFTSLSLLLLVSRQKIPRRVGPGWDLRFYDYLTHDFSFLFSFM